MIVAKDGKKQAEPEQEDMAIKENESGVTDFSMMEETREQANETAEKKKSANENSYKAKIEIKEGNTPVKDKKVKNVTEEKNNTLEFTKVGIKRKIEQSEESAAEVRRKRMTHYEEADESKGKNMMFPKFF